MNQTVIEKLAGLQVLQNSLTVQPGFFERADNVTIVQDYLVTKRRGLREHVRFPSLTVCKHLFDFGTSVFAVCQTALFRVVAAPVSAQVSCTSGSPTVTVTATAHGLSTGYFVADFQVINTDAFVGSFVRRQADFYGTRLVTVTGPNTFTFDADANATATTSSAAMAASFRSYKQQGGQAVSVTSAGVRTSRSLKANSNAYFTTDNGVLKLEREDLPLLKAGIAPGLDAQGTLGLSPTGTASGPVEPFRQIAYKVLFGRRDANQNLVLGEPSEALVLRNTVTDVVASGVVLGAVDSGGTGFRLVTVTVPGGHGLPAGLSTIYLFSTNSTGITIADRSSFQATFVSATVFTFNVANATTAIGPLSFGTNKTTYLTFSLPSEVTSTEFIFQLYRTNQSASLLSLPEENYRLLEERNLVAGEISNGFVDYTDETDQILVQSGAQLYTNPTVEGPLQENARPPRAEDVCQFKGFCFYANTTAYRTLELAIVAPSLIANADFVTLGLRSYIFRGNAANEPVGNERTTSPATTAGFVEVTRTNHGFLVGDTIRVVSVAGLSGVAPGIFTVSAVPTANTFRFGSGAGGSGTVVYEGVADTLGKRLVKRTITSALVTLSESIALTARALVKAINRDGSSTVYARYTSAPNATPGKMFFEAKDINAVTFAAIVSNALASPAFLPDLPTSGISVSDTQESAPNELRISKLNEPEAAPRVNTLRIGTKSAKILRAVPLRDSLIVLKEDGVFRVNGDLVTNFSATALDTTVVCKARESVAVLNNGVFCLSNQGVVQITDSSVKISSREIEPFFTAVLGKPELDAATAGVGYESERVYMLATIRPNSTSQVPDVVYVYNYLTNAWTTHSGPDALFLAGLVVSTDDKLVVAQADNTARLNKERKDQTKVDFSGQETCVPIIVGEIATAQASQASADVLVGTVGDHGLALGDVITISSSSAALASAFSGGVADANGPRVVTSVPSSTSFTFAAATLAVAAGTGTLHWVKGISEAAIATSVTSGSSTVTLTTTVAHGLESGGSLTIHSLSTAVAAAFSLPGDLTGYRTATVVDAMTFTVQASNPPIGNATGTVNLSDRTQARMRLTALTLSTYQPQVGDAIVTGSSIYVIVGVQQFSTTAYVLSVRFKYKALSTALAFIHSAYKSALRFAPLTFGNSGMLKYFSEFQATFRNGASCSRLLVNFSTDAFVSVAGNQWDFAVGGSGAPVSFGGWGSLPWGQFPWGGGTSIQREFTTRPAVLLRMYIPKDAFVGTFLQPVLEHKVAGEPFELQSISVFQQKVTQRVGK